MSDTSSQPHAPRLEPQPEHYSLLTDLYQLTMSVCYHGSDIADRPASFELFARQFPRHFGYAIAMGLEQALQYLEAVRFSEAQLAALQRTRLFDRAPVDFWQRLADFRFGGTVYAVAEGTAVLPHEPIVRIEAPLWQAQIVETYLLNTINYQTLIATRAARMRDVAGDRATLLEFGTRRAFSPQAALWAARAALAAGFDATSNVLAALELGQRPSGTMAHALVLAFNAIEQNEVAAFSAFNQYFPGAPLLVDTFDTIAAVRELAAQREAGTLETRGVRIDSGDIPALSQQVREILPDVPIFASGDVDEWEIARAIAAGARIDGYGIGTRLVSGSALGGVYKLVDLDGTPVAKRSPGKATYPGRKQIWRSVSGDRLGLMTEAAASGEQALLQCVMRDGTRQLPTEPLDTIAQRTKASVAALPVAARSLDCTTPVLPTISAALQALNQTLPS